MSAGLAATGPDLIRAMATSDDDRWFSGLGERLAAERWADLQDACGLYRSDYGTARVLAADAKAPRHDVSHLTLPKEFQAATPIVVERLAGDALERYEDLGLDLRGPNWSQAPVLTGRLRAAFRRLAEVPQAAAAIGAVLSTVHVATPEDPDYDVSYSDPAVPFSIFVGVFPSELPNGDLRLAEGILHECMHLQLTMIERALPMVAGADARQFSPWQGTMRPAQGILHGLYVFRVIQDFFQTMLANGQGSQNVRAYLERRIATIDEEVSELTDFPRNPDLTADGRMFAAALLTT